MWWGGLNFVVAVAIIVANPGSTWWSEVVTYGDVLAWFAYAGIQALLVISAGMAISTMPSTGSIGWLFFGSAVRVGLYLFVLLLIAMIPQPIIERQPGAESVAIGDLRAINSSQAAYSSVHRDRGYASTFEELQATNFMRVLGAQAWYRFEMTSSRDGSGIITGYQAWATRLRPLELCRSFFSDESGVIRFTKEDRRATATDPELP
jgi:hypothetical protein